MKISPCAKNANSPDRIVFVGVNWDYTTAAQWLTAYDAVIKTLQAKFPAVTEIDIDTLIRGPNNMDCGAPTNGLHEVVDAQSIATAFYRDVFGPAASRDPETALVRIRAG